jgi:hypothetical protein
MPGIKMNGISKLNFLRAPLLWRSFIPSGAEGMLRPFLVWEKVSNLNLTSRRALAHNADFTEFITTRCGKAGFYAGSTTDVHRTARTLRI